MIFFLNSANRVYGDKELNKVAKLLFSSGVFNTQQPSEAAWRDGGDFYVEADSETMALTARPGSATVRAVSEEESVQVLIQEDGALSATVSPNSDIALRVDAVVLRVDQSVITGDTLNAAGSNAVSLVVVAGSDDQPLTDDEIQLALGNDTLGNPNPFVRLADVSVPNGATSLTQSAVSDVRQMPKMSRSVKGAFDRVQLYALAQDPEQLEQGDIWFNVTEGILKIFDGVHKVALQTEAFDWGFYPPDGLYDNFGSFDALYDNDGSNGTTNDIVFAMLDVTHEPATQTQTAMTASVFKYPTGISNPLMRVKIGNAPHPQGMTFGIYSADVDNKPDTLIESLGAPSLPANDYVNFYLDGSLYTAGNNYVIVAHQSNLAFWDGDNLPYSYILSATPTAENAGDFFIGVTTSYDNDSLEFDPLDMTWSTVNTGRSWVMSIQERTKLHISEEDTSGQNFKISQAFTARAKDIIGFAVVKGDSVGSPTDDIDVSIYGSDDQNRPKGDVLATGAISQTEWEAYNEGDTVVIPVAFDSLVVGERYVVVIETEDHDDDNTYTIMFGASTTGTARRNTTAEGWLPLNGDIFYGIQVSAVRKIVVTGDNGLIDPSLLPVTPKRVQYVVSSATPGLNVEESDALCITALAEDITSMTTNLIGTPYDFQELIVRITTTGIRAIAWGAMFEAAGVALDVSVASGKTLTARFLFNAVSGKFGCVSSVEST